MSATPAARRLPRPFGEDEPLALHAWFDAIITVDAQQRIVMVNQAAEHMFGCSAADALGSPLTRFIPSRHRNSHGEHVLALASAAEVDAPLRLHTSVVGLRANGEEFPIEASISMVHAASDFGPQRYFVALIHDVNQGHGLLNEIDALRSGMRAIFELAPVAIWITEADQIVFANHACAELFGAIDREVLVGRSIYSLLEPNSHHNVRQTVAQALTGGAPAATVNERIARLDGALRDVEIAVAALPDHGHTAVQMVITDMTERSRQNQELEQSRRELRWLSASLVDTREEERRRIARELHDELGQRLTALKMELSSLASHPEPKGAQARIQSMLDMVDDTVASVRRIATDLRPLMLDDLGLYAAIEWLARESSRRMGIEITLKLGDGEPPVGEALSIALYRIVQEALTNVARHAHASKVLIELQQHAGELVLSVQDNGVGFSAKSMHQEGSHGLMGIRERAYMLGGKLEISESPKGGGRIDVRLPIGPSRSAAGPASARWN